MSAPPYSIGSEHLPGLSKLIEECGEVLQIAGKTMGVGHDQEHWTEDSLKHRMQEELGDLQAAITFYIEKNELDDSWIDGRVQDKYELFCKWHQDNLSAGRIVE